jgi:hypothetical protein
MVTWISVKDQLPEIHEKVTVFSENSSESLSDHLDTDWLQRLGSEAFFAENNGPVTHWTRDIIWPS